MHWSLVRRCKPYLGHVLSKQSWCLTSTETIRLIRDGERHLFVDFKHITVFISSMLISSLPKSIKKYSFVYLDYRTQNAVHFFTVNKTD